MPPAKEARMVTPVATQEPDDPVTDCSGPSTSQANVSVSPDSVRVSMLPAAS